MLASEYGMTPDYALNQLSRAEVEALLGAIGRRYQRQADAMKSTKAPGPTARAGTYPPSAQAGPGGREEVATPLSGHIATSIDDVVSLRSPSMMGAFNMKVRGVRK